MWLKGAKTRNGAFLLWMTPFESGLPTSAFHRNQSKRVPPEVRAQFAVSGTTAHRSAGAREEQQKQRGVASRGACPPSRPNRTQMATRAMWMLSGMT